MGNSTNKSNIEQSITNDFLQQLDDTCSATCTNDVSGNTVIISGSAGDVTIETQCTADASCSMTNQAANTVTSSLANLATQNTTSTGDFMGDLFGGAENSTNIVNTMSNYITQISSQTCAASSQQTVDNNLIYVSPTGSAGNLTLSATGDTSASCTMSNMIKIQAYNESQSSTDQSASSTGMFAAIFISFAVIILIGGIVLVMLLATGVIGFGFLSGGSKNPDELDDILGDAGDGGGGGGGGGGSLSGLVSTATQAAEEFA